jgi:subtilisin family serine protease
LTLRYTPASGLQEKEIFLDNQLLIKFSNPFITQNIVEQFARKYDLTIVHIPEKRLPQFGNYTYIFRRKQEPTIEKNAATLAAAIYEENAGLIDEAVPNMLNMFHADGDNFMTSVSWHLNNFGQTRFCNVESNQTCNTRITDVWELGYTGQGIKIGLIDVHGFDYTHPDLIGRLAEGWDFIHDRPLNRQTSSAEIAGQSHGMAVAGIMAAKASKNTAVMGVAYNAKIVPFLVDLSDASIIKAMQKAMLPEFDVDILNCSFSGTGNNPLIEAEINNLIRLGRNRLGEPLGVVIVCSAGNDNMSDEFVPYYPAYYDGVIAVSAITPEDLRKDINDKWNHGSKWAPNYGRKIHVAAPGICIPTTDFSGPAGYSSSDYISFSRTSAAAPIVSGVAALLLSKNSNMTYEEVIRAIADGAEKVGGYNYHYDPDRPGHSKEIGYGRINAYNTIQGITVDAGYTEKHHKNCIIAVENPVTAKLHVNYDISMQQSDVILNVYDLSGNLMQEAMLPKEQHLLILDVDDYPAGMFITCFINPDEKKLLHTSRFIKLW